MDSYPQVAHIIPTHERPRVAQRLVDSIRHFYPESPIYVCDDSREPSTYDGAADVPATAYDIGLSAKRNLMVQASDEPYIFVWDDDYVCTSNTSVGGFLEILQALDRVGIVGGEWTLDVSDQRNVWFCGEIIPDGATVRIRPPSKKSCTVSVESGTYRYHKVALNANWFLADRRTLEACPWDEELKLNEHLEFFARLSALRGKQGNPDFENDTRFFERWKKLQRGEPIVEPSEKGMIMIQARGTFRNATHLSHLPNNMIRRDQWAEVPKEYGEQLINGGKAVSLSTEHDTRPFPLSDVSGDVPLSVVMCPEWTCKHHRYESRGDDYNGQRFRRNTFMPLQKEKLGASERDLVQWPKYPGEEPDFEEPNSNLLELPTP